MKIAYFSHGKPTAYAAEELARYVRQMDGGADPRVTEHSKGAEEDVVLGLLSDFGMPMPEVTDPVIEDLVVVEIENGHGIIAGSNERSVLMGVYRYLRSAGARFLRPGPDGEYIPTADFSRHTFRYRKKADLDFRGECSEGAISYEHMRDIVLWMPKVGLNMYMIEGLVPYTYMHKWYAHVGNTKLHLPGTVTPGAMLEEKIARLEEDIVRTGLQFHNVGHGWMFVPLGLMHADPETEKAFVRSLAPEKKELLALVGGKRDLYGESTFYTNFCYSNPEARRTLVNFWVDYAKRKPYVDFFHIWLADAPNNHCECEACRRLEPSDWYVILLNEIDEALTAIGCKTRLVLILYVDLLRPPKTETLRHPERFVIVQAAGGDYRNGYGSIPAFSGEEPPYERNRWKSPSLSLAQKWRGDWIQKMGVKMKSMVYEYRFYTDQYADPGYMQVAREVSRDMKLLPAMHYDGNMSDGTQRHFFPTGLPMAVLGETTFDLSTDFDTFADGYLRDEFGENYETAKEYLERVSTTFRPDVLSAEESVVGTEEEGVVFAKEKIKGVRNNPDYAEAMRSVEGLVREYEPKILAEVSRATDRARRRSWNNLAYHLRLVAGLGRVLLAEAEGDRPRAQAELLCLTDELSSFEMQIDSEFDLFLFLRFFRAKVGLPPVPYFE